MWKTIFLKITKNTSKFFKFSCRIKKKEKKKGKKFCECGVQKQN